MRSNSAISGGWLCVQCGVGMEGTGPNRSQNDLSQKWMGSHHYVAWLSSSFLWCLAWNPNRGPSGLWDHLLLSSLTSSAPATLAWAVGLQALQLSPASRSSYLPSSLLGMLSLRSPRFHWQVPSVIQASVQASFHSLVFPEHPSLMPFFLQSVSHSTDSFSS